MQKVLNIISQAGQVIQHLFQNQNSFNSKFGTLKGILKSDALAKLLSFESFDPDLGIFVSQNSIGIVIEAMPMVGDNEPLQKLLTSLCEDFVCENASMQFLLLADHRIQPFLDWWSKGEKGGICSGIAANRKKYFKDGNVSARNFRFFVSYSLPYVCRYDKEGIFLRDIKQRMLKLLQTFTLAHEVGPQVFLETADGLLNVKTSSEFQRRSYNDLENLSTQLMSGVEAKIERDGICFNNEMYFKSFYVSDRPANWSFSAMQNLIGDPLKESFRLKFPFFIHYGVHFPSQIKGELYCDSQPRLTEKQSYSNYFTQMIPKLASEKRKHDSVQRKRTEGAKFIWSQFSCGFWSNKEDVCSAEQSLRDLYKDNQLNLIENHHNHLSHLISILPMAWGGKTDELKNKNVLKTASSSECPLFIPIQGEWSGTPNPGMLLIGRRGQLFNWNLFDSKSGNYNTIVAGQNDIGKSLFMQDMLLNGLRMGVKVYILDLHRKYKKLCALVGGQEVKFSKNSNICLNPFSKIKFEDEEEKKATFSMLKSLIAFLASPNNDDKHEEYLIELAIQIVWIKKGTSATITDIVETLQNMVEKKALILSSKLTPYTKNGIYAKYFEGENNVDLQNALVVIELEDLNEKKDLQAIILQLFIMDIANHASLGDRKTPFYICMDEIWDLLQTPQTGNFIETLAKKLHKYNGALIVGIQEIEKLFITPGAKAAFENSHWFAFLSQKKGAIQKIVENGKWQHNPSLLQAIGSLVTEQGDVSEILICDGVTHYSIGKLKLDPYSNYLYSAQSENYINSL